MDLILTRHDFRMEGIFGTLSRKDILETIAVTGEHAYPSFNRFLPKVPSGTYTCQRGIHQLEHGDSFETFEVLNVPGHSGILLHRGCYPNKDSEGCILLGQMVVDLPRDAAWWIDHSKITFQKFMDLQTGSNQFRLDITES